MFGTPAPYGHRPITKFWTSPAMIKPFVSNPNRITRMLRITSVLRSSLIPFDPPAMERRLDGPSEGTLGDLLPQLFERLRTDRFTLDVLRAGTLHPQVEKARRATQALFTQALERAVADGSVRPDVTYADMAVLVLGAAGQLAEFEDFDPERWRRHAGLVWAAIRA